MRRKPFNPDLIPIPPVAATTSAAREAATPAALTVTQLAALIKDAVARSIPGKVRVVGEISNFSDRNHWFFSLKDAGATIKCVCFASSARKVGFPVRDGIEVVATGRIDYFEGQGQLQLYVDKLEPVGQGALELKFRALCEELRQLGYFDEERKKALPAVPRRIVVITSRTGAALQDVINTAGRRWHGCALTLIDVHVQGAAAAPEIAAAVEAVSRDGKRLGIDAVLLTRGGGSIEDLWAFNERIVADAIFRCTLPVVAAIGHETDTTVAELVADRRCSTPTQAAMTLIPDAGEMARQVSHLGQRLAMLVRREFQQSRQRLDAAIRHAFFRKPATMIQPLRQRLETLAMRLAATPRIVIQKRERFEQLARRIDAGPRLLRQKRDRLDALARQLAAVSPLNVLQRGYTYTLGPDGRVLRSAADVTSGTRLTTVLSDGRVESEVLSDPLPAAEPRPGEGDSRSESGEGRSHRASVASLTVHRNRPPSQPPPRGRGKKPDTTPNLFTHP